MRSSTTSRWTNERARAADIFERIVGGATYDEVGRHYGVTKNKAAQRANYVRQTILSKYSHPSEVPESALEGVKGMRTNSEWWLDRVAEFRARFCQ